MARDFILRDIAVVDTGLGTVSHHMDVRVSQDRIVSVEPTGATHDDADIIESAGTYVTPGFIDMHAHVMDADDPAGVLDLMLAHGITGFRQMAGSPDLLRRRRDNAMEMSPTAPRLVSTCGTLITPFNGATNDEVRAEIRRQHADGADFIKVGLCPADVFPAAQEEASTLGIPVLGHLPAGFPVRDAARNGMRCIEHLGPGVTMLAACSTDEDAIMASLPTGSPIPVPNIKSERLNRIFEKLALRLIKRIVVNPVQLNKSADVDALRHAIDTFDETKARELARDFVRYGTWHCPTLIRVRTQEQCDHHTFSDDPDLGYVAPKVRKVWEKASRRFTKKFSAEQREVFDDLYQLQLRVVRIFDEEGVPMLVGSDTVGAGWVVPGGSFHREIDELASAGLSAKRILKMATFNAAVFSGTTELTGSVSAGALADLTVLAADPTTDPSHLHAVAGVVRNGQWFGKADLDQIKDAIRNGKHVA